MVIIRITTVTIKISSSPTTVLVGLFIKFVLSKLFVKAKSRTYIFLFAVSIYYSVSYIRMKKAGLFEDSFF